MNHISQEWQVGDQLYRVVRDRSAIRLERMVLGVWLIERDLWLPIAEARLASLCGPTMPPWRLEASGRSEARGYRLVDGLSQVSLDGRTWQRNDSAYAILAMVLEASPDEGRS